MTATQLKLLRRRTQHRGVKALMALTCCGALGLFAPAAQAASWLDALLGGGNSQGEAVKAGSTQRIWRLRDFSYIALVEREPGAAENRQPVRVPAEVLRLRLGQVQTIDRNGTAQKLFDAGELAELAAPLAQALDLARPGDDVLLLSAARREGGILASPRAVTARLFVQGQQLQMIVHDARFEFYDAYRGTHTEPRFTFGSRGAPARGVSISSTEASSIRSDWLALPLQGSLPTDTPVPALPARVSADGVVPTLAPAPAAEAAPPRRALNAAAAEDVERRLEILKRLRDKSLITEDEFQQKRKEILQLL